MLPFGIIVSIVISLSELIKKIGIIPVKYIPILNLIMGLGFSIAYGGTDLKTSFINGLIIGLSASGIYSGYKNVREGINKDRDDRCEKENK